MFSIINNLWQAGLKAGDHHFTARERKKANRLINQLVMASLCLIGLHIISSYTYASTSRTEAFTMAMLIPVVALELGSGLLVGLFWHLKNKTGKMIYIGIALYIGIFYLTAYAAFVATSDSLRLLLLLLVPIPFLLWDVFSVTYHIATAVLIFASMIFCYFWNYYNPPFFAVDEQAVMIITVEIYFVLVAGLSLFSYLFWKEGPARLRREPVRIDPGILKTIPKKLEDLMRNQELYRDEDLNVDKLAAKLEIRPDQLSEYLNAHLKMGFARWLNQFRIDAAMEIIKSDPAANILQTAYRVGFNSKTVFNRWFRTLVGMTPSQYRRSLNGEPTGGTPGGETPDPQTKTG